MIIDLDDLNWAEVFTEEELDEMCDFGDPVLRELPAGLNDALAELQEKVLYNGCEHWFFVSNQGNIDIGFGCIFLCPANALSSN